MLSRRAALRAAGAATAAGVAGCARLRQRSPLRRSVPGTVPVQQVDSARRGHLPDVAGPRTDPAVAWSADVGAEVRSSPVVADSTVYVGARRGARGSGQLVALDAVSGLRRWRIRLDDSPVFPSLFRNRLVVTKHYGHVQVDPASGDVVAEGEGEVFRPPAFAGTTLLSVDDGVAAVDLGTGRMRWSTGELDDGTPPATDGRRVYVGTNGDVVRAWNLDGTPAWTGRVGRDVTTAPTVAGGTVLAGAVDFAVHALDAASGDRSWRFETGGPVYASPAVAGGTVHAASTDGALYALDLADGTERWRLDTGDSLDTGFRVGPVVAGEVVYAADVGGRVHAVDAGTGEKLWEVAVGGPAVAPPSVVEGFLFVPVHGGRVVAVAGGVDR